MARLKHTRSRSKSFYFIALLLLLAGAGGAAYLLFFEGEKPQVRIDSPTAFVGSKAMITVAVADRKSGIRNFSLRITQGDTAKEIYRQDFPRNGYTGVIGVAEKSVSIPFQPKENGFTDGPAQLELAASDYSLRGLLSGNSARLVKELVIDTTPPKLTILHSERYINPGGSGIVIYRCPDAEVTSGVRIGDHFHPGHLIGDGRDDTYIAYFALPYTAASIDEAGVEAVDPAGNKAVQPFSVIFQEKRFRKDRIDVGDGFLDKKVPEFARHYPEMSGSPIEKYLYTNSEIRRLNNDRIRQICSESHPERLWEERFLRMPGATRAGFADHRTYYYRAAPVDEQVHLGIDIASTRQAEVRAAARGIVVFADYLGIYGNVVILDHGQGVFSLYSHLSRIDVTPPDMIERNEPIGATGTTGMAGGDHLHFAVIVNGVFVTPLEWWDQHWIDVTIEEPLTESRFQ